MSETLQNSEEGEGVQPEEISPDEAIGTPALAEAGQVFSGAEAVEAGTTLPPGEAATASGLPGGQEGEPTGGPPGIAQQAPVAGEIPGETVSHAPPPSPAGPAPTRPALVTRLQAFWMMVAGSLGSFFLAVVFVLVLLSVINGGLRYTRPKQLSDVQSRLDGLSQQVGELSQKAEALQASLDGMDTRLAKVESLGGRVGAVESELERLQKDVTDATAQVGSFQGKIDSLSLQVDALLQRTGTFQKFLDGLGGLLKNLFQPEAP